MASWYLTAGPCISAPFPEYPLRINYQKMDPCLKSLRLALRLCAGTLAERRLPEDVPPSEFEQRCRSSRILRPGFKTEVVGPHFGCRRRALLAKSGPRPFVGTVPQATRTLGMKGISSAASRLRRLKECNLRLDRRLCRFGRLCPRWAVGDAVLAEIPHYRHCGWRLADFAIQLVEP